MWNAQILTIVVRLYVALNLRFISLMQSQDSFGRKKYEDTLVRAESVHFPWALQAELSGHY